MSSSCFSCHRQFLTNSFPSNRASALSASSVCPPYCGLSAHLGDSVFGEVRIRRSHGIARLSTPVAGCGASQSSSEENWKRELSSQNWISDSCWPSRRWCCWNRYCPEAGSRRWAVRAGEGSVDGGDDGDCFGSPLRQQQRWCRRELVAATSSWIAVLGIVDIGSASADDATAEDDQSPASSTADSAKAGLIERLLERSKVNKAKYDQERLDGYYRRNYKDYFEFLKGTIRDKDKGTLTDAEKGILRWLEKNQ